MKATSGRKAIELEAKKGDEPRGLRGLDMHKWETIYFKLAHKNC